MAYVRVDQRLFSQGLKTIQRTRLNPNLEFSFATRYIFQRMTGFRWVGRKIINIALSVPQI